MAVAPKIGLQTNIPTVGTLMYADFQKSNQGYSDQLRVKGEWDGHGEGVMFLPLACKDQLAALGVIPSEPNERGSYKVNGRPRVRVLRSGEGRDSRTTVTLDGAPPPYTAPPASNGAANAPHATNGQPSAPPAAAHGRAAATAANHESPATTVVRLNQTMAACLKAAKATYCMLFGIKDSEFPAELIPTVATTAHTLFISRTNKGLLSAAPQAPPTVASDAQLRSIEALAATLGIKNGAPLKDEWKIVCPGIDTMAPTTQQAEKIIAEFQRRVAAKAEEERRAAEAAAQAPPDDGPQDYDSVPVGGGGYADGSIPF